LIKRLATIAVHTFKEAARERVLYNLVVFALLMIAAAILVGHISVGIEETVLINLGLSSISVFGVLIAIFVGIGLVYKEIERRTVYSILSKPVHRWEFIVGKYAGLLLTLLVNTGIMTAGFYAALFYQKRHLGIADLKPLGAVYFILLELAMVVGIAIFFSCMSTPILSAVFTFCVYLIGHFLSEIRFLGQESKNGIVEKITAGIYYLLPNFSDFDVIARTAHRHGISKTFMMTNSLYALLYVVVLASAAILIFEEREFR
jgi:ABC-type transport system involved in multi-copper enzyme maturation permease subunit